MAIRTGTTGDNSLTGTVDKDFITGDAGNDVLTGLGGDDFLDGGSGDDSIYGGTGNDLIIDGSGIDYLYGGDGIDTFLRDWTGLAANTFVLDLNFFTGLQSAVGEDSLGADRFTGIENYTVFGEISGIFTGDDRGNVIRSDLGTDTLIGNGGNDGLFAGGGNDTLQGGKGADALHGEAGRDVLTGGAGNDRFYFDLRGQGPDRITDFSGSAGNNDTLYFRAEAFATMVPGGLSSDQFVIRADNLAQDANDRFIFDTSDHTLWFDSNGNGNFGLTQIAVFSAQAVVTWEDILLF